jgi:hypothetical protein
VDKLLSKAKAADEFRLSSAALFLLFEDVERVLDRDRQGHRCNESSPARKNNGAYFGTIMRHQNRGHEARDYAGHERQNSPHNGSR